MKQVLKKLIKRTVDRVSNTETIINERIEKELLSSDELDELSNQFADDSESAYDKGIYLDFDDGFCFIDLDKLACGLEDFIGNDEEDWVMLVEIKKKIEQWRAYGLYFEREG